MDMPMNRPVFHGMTEACEHMAYWAEWSMAISGTDLLEVPSIYKAYIRPI